MWDGNLTNVGVREYQAWAIVNPYWPNPNPFVAGGGGGYRFYNALEPSPLVGTEREGDFFCAGQRWLSNGRLFVAGGTRKYPIDLPLGSPAVFEGSKLVYQWDETPNASAGYPFGRWFRMLDLAVERWYPTVTTDGTTAERTLVLGGTDWPGTGWVIMPEVNNYEAYRNPFGAFPPVATAEQKLTGSDPRLYLGPPLPLLAPFTGTVPGFNNYPRIHALGVLDPIGGGGFAPRLFVSGYWSMGFFWAHDPNVNPAYGYNIGVAGLTAFIDDGTSLLYPAAIGAVPSLVLRIGGAWRTTFPGPVVPSRRVESSVVTGSATTSASWSSGGPTDLPNMERERFLANIVMLPTRELFAIGGYDANGDANLHPEIFRVTAGWKYAANHDSPRNYHSTAVLLPDGRVFVAGGEDRTSDYQLYEPEYLNVLPSHRPQGVSLLNEGTWGPISQTQLSGVGYGQAYVATLSSPLPVGIAVEEAVLMAPSAVTHHDDGGQRCIPLLVQDSIDPPIGYNSVRVNMPASQQHAPPGWYMLFLLSSAGVPSNAFWINLR